MSVPMLETPRLFLTPLVSEDAAQIQQIFPRWEIVRYLIASVPWPYPEGAAQHYVDNVALAASQKGTGWFWTLRHKEEADVHLLNGHAGQQPGILAGTRMAGKRIYDGSLPCGNRLLVQCA